MEPVAARAWLRRCSGISASVVAPAAVVLAEPYAQRCGPVALPAPQSAPAVTALTGCQHLRHLRLLLHAPAATTLCLNVASCCACGSGKIRRRAKRKSSYVYRMPGPDGDDVVIVTGKGGS